MVVVTATLDQLHTAAGVAVTAGGTLLPIPDLIRMATHAHHYLCIFNTHDRRPLYLGRTKRIATSDQRLVLHANDGASRAHVSVTAVRTTIGAGRRPRRGFSRCSLGTAYAPRCGS
jgi:hypothetical protein